MWGLISADLHAVYGIDVATDVLKHRSASWLVERIFGVLQRDTLTARAVANRRKET